MPVTVPNKPNIGDIVATVASTVIFLSILLTAYSDDSIIVLSLSLWVRLFNTLFNEIDLTETNKYESSATIMQYLDFAVTLSKRAAFLEKVIPVEGLYVGLTGHLYFPILFVKNDSTIRMGPGDPNPSTGIIDNYKLNTKQNLTVGSNGLIVGLLRNVPTGRTLRLNGNSSPVSV